MTRLLRVELRRLFSRRLVVLTMLGALVASFLVLLGVWQSSEPMSGEEVEVAEQMYQQELQYWEEQGQDDIDQCLADQEAEAERTGVDVDFGCDWGPPELDSYLVTAPQLEDSLPVFLGAHASIVIFAALLIGVTFTAAELSTGAMSTWLSFEPRRLRVYASKLAAAALGVLPVVVVSLAVVVAGATLIANHFGLADTMGAADWGAAAAMALRVTGLVVVVALVGSALGILLRHTAAALGLGVVYLVAEQIVRGLVPEVAPWVLSTNVMGWVAGGTVYYVDECITEAGGTMCEFTEHALSLGHSVVYLLVLAVVVVTTAAVVFRRRDAA